MAHTVRVEKPARPANPNGHVSDEETGPERRCCCLQVTQPLSQLDLDLSCSHFIPLFSLPPGAPLLHSLEFIQPGLELGRDWGWWLVQVEKSSLEWWESSASEVRQTCVLLLAPLLLAV